MAPNAMRWVGGARGTGRALPREDIEKALDIYCAIPPATKDNPEARISNSSFNHITKLLSESSNSVEYCSGSAERPRLFTVLRTINRLDALPDFVKQNLFDLDLPFEPENLPVLLGQSKQAFIKFQKHVLTPFREVELGVRGEHVTFGGKGDEHFISNRLLGGGGQGTVDEVLSRLGYQFYARKVFFRRDNSAEIAKQFKNEMTALKRLRHRHLVKIVGSYTDRDTFGILMLPVADHNLLKFLEKAREADFPALRSFFGCLASTLSYLHDQQIHHMDLKLRNILIKSGNIYVADFGSAHDWSAEGRSTTLTPGPYTPRYAPPELFKRPSAPRNWATDMWSLGIVYLEMVTVLRGKKVQQLRNFLVSNGSKDAFVSGNPTATYAWFDVLRENILDSSSDNEPLIWVKDLIADVPENRIKAHSLLQQILKSGPIWRRDCCAEPFKRKYQLQSNGTVQEKTELVEGTSEDQSPVGNTSFHSATKPDTPSVRLADLPNSYPETQQQAWNWKESRGRPSHEQLYQVVEDGAPTPWTYSRTSSEEEIPRRLQNFDFLDEPAPDPRLEKGELGDYSDDSRGINTYEVCDDSSGDDDSQDMTAKPHSDMVRALSEFRDEKSTEDGSPAERKSSATQSEMWNGDLNKDQMFVTDEPEVVNGHSPHKTASFLYGEMFENPWLSTPGEEKQPFWPSSGTANVASDDHSKSVPSSTATPQALQTCRERSNGLSENISSTLLVRANNSQEESAAEISAEDDKSLDSQRTVHRAKSFVRTRPSVKPEGSAQPVDKLAVNYVIIRPKESAKEATNSDNLKVTQVVKQTANKASGVQMSSTQSGDVKASPVQQGLKTKSNADDTALKPTKPSVSATSPLTLGNLRSLNRDNKENENPDQSQSIGRKGQPLLTIDPFKAQASSGERQRTPYQMSHGKPASSRTSAKLANDTSPASRFRGARRPPNISAETYINEVYIEESEAATSVMSEAAEAKIRNSMSLNKYLDKSYDYLQYFAKDGNAPAVRVLLEKGVNPGTKDKPRTRPLLAAIQGKSDRHVKCARALLEKGADPNVKLKNGKPALHVAIDHPYYKGYVRLICDLLENGADPNIRDVAGDTALHKILLGGYDPLPKHRRDALAMLIKFGADVEAVPRGTLQKPIHLAVRRQDRWAVSMLLHKGASAKDRDSAGMSPLDLAVASWSGRITNDQKQVLLHLLCHGSGVNVNEKPSSQSRLALHAAIICHDDEVVRILTQDHNASPELLGADGKNAFRVLSDVNANDKMDVKVHWSILEALKEASTARGSDY